MLDRFISMPGAILTGKRKKNSEKSSRNTRLANTVKIWSGPVPQDEYLNKVVEETKTLLESDPGLHGISNDFLALARGKSFAHS